jgi:hypothetical protein
MKSLSVAAAAATLSFLSVAHGAADSCSAAAPTTPSAAPKPAAVHSAPANVQHKFHPRPRPGADTANRANLVPTRDVELAYLCDDDDVAGNINMRLAMNRPAVVLEEVDAISGAACGDDFVTVSFADADALAEALADWTDADMRDGFFIVTNDLGNCDEEFERGFFLASDVQEDKGGMTITVKALKQALPEVAGMF